MIERATRELDCYNQCMMRAIEHVANNRFDKAAAYHENASRSLLVLHELKSINDQARFIIGQLQADHDQVDVLNKVASGHE